MMPNTHDIQDAAERLLRRCHPVSSARHALQDADHVWQGIVEQGWPVMLAPQTAGGLGLDMQAACAVVTAAGKFLLNVPLAANMAILPTVCADAPGALHDVQTRMHGQGSCVASSATPSRLPLVGVKNFPWSFFAWGDEDPHGGAWVEGAHAQRDMVMLCDDGLLCLPPVAGVLGLDPTMPVAHVTSWRPQARIALPTASVIRTRQRLRALRLAETLGAAEAALDLAVAYAKDRQQFGKPIGVNQAVKHKLADCWMALDDATLALQAAAQGLDAAAADVDDRLNAAQWLVVDGGLRTVQQAVQTHGAMGITWECDVHLYLKRVLRVTGLLQLHATQAQLLERTWDRAVRV